MSQRLEAAILERLGRDVGIFQHRFFIAHLEPMRLRLGMTATTSATYFGGLGGEMGKEMEE